MNYLQLFDWYSKTWQVQFICKSAYIHSVKKENLISHALQIIKSSEHIA